MKKQIVSIALLLCTTLITASAQSTALYGGSVLGKNVITGGTDIDVADSLYIGSGPHNIDGTWEIYSTYVQIDPNAVISGSGTIVFYNPSLGFGSSSPTFIDVNNISNPIDVNIDIQNDQTVRLTELPLSGDLISAGWVENTTNNSFYVGRDLNFGIDGGHLILGNSVQADLIFDNDATVSGFRPSRHAVSNNSILSHVTKQNYTSSFTFPVGIAAGDYTPAQISNASSNTVSVSVQDYVNSTSLEALTDGTINTADGMNRTWNIYAGTAGISSTVTLQHNSSTNQSGFVDGGHFITRWGSTIPNATGDFTIPYSMSSWQTNAQGPGATGALSSTGSVVGSSMRSRTYSSGLATSPSANESYFTKSTDMEHPLPVVLEQFNATGKDCSVRLDWKTGVEDNIDHYEIQHSYNGITFTSVASIKAVGSGGVYTYMHQAPVNGVNLYRLQMVERTNDYTISKTVRALADCSPYTTNISLFPNPTEGDLTLDGLFGGKSSTNPANEEVLIRIVNIYGQVVFQQKAKQNKELIDIKELAQASYVVQVLYNKQIKTQIKFVKL